MTVNFFLYTPHLLLGFSIVFDEFPPIIHNHVLQLR